MRTYQTRLKLTSEQSAWLDAYAELQGRIERKRFAALASGKALEKNDCLRRFNITARQFNATARPLQGKISSIKQRRKGLITEAQQRIKKAEKVIRLLEKKLKKVTSPQEAHSLRFKLHQKKRRLQTQRDRLARMEQDHQQERVRLCFGSRKLFRAQFDLEANGYNTLDEWREDWSRTRACAFYVLGSKDETAGCQGCVAQYQGDNRFTFRLRLPNTLIKAHHTHKYLRFEAILPYGTDTLLTALTLNQAVSYRFLKEAKGWRLFITTAAIEQPQRSHSALGSVGVDINTDHLAITETDRFGNPLKAVRIPLITYGCSPAQAKARIGEAVKAGVSLAVASSKLIALEKLDFAKKKAELENQGIRYRRRLSSFAYSRMVTRLMARAFDQGIKVKPVDPAYPSRIGKHKFAQQYGMSNHQAAALTIGRRALYLSERPNRQDPNALPLPVRNRGRHVGSFWRQVSQRVTVHVARQRLGLGTELNSVPSSVRQGVRSYLCLQVGSLPANRLQHCSVDVHRNIFLCV
jgi:transposase, IS605 OrfB family, central region